MSAGDSCCPRPNLRGTRPLVVKRHGTWLVLRRVSLLEAAIVRAHDAATAQQVAAQRSGFTTAWHTPAPKR